MQIVHVHLVLDGLVTKLIGGAVAKTTFHSTGKEAALIAQKAKVGQLLVGHFSARYKQPDSILEEAKSIFANTHAITEGDVYNVGRSQ